jgi:hypothetical protein
MRFGRLLVVLFFIVSPGWYCYAQTYSQDFREKNKPTDSTGYAFAKMNGSNYFDIYYDNGVIEDFKELKKLKWGSYGSYGAVISIQFMLLKHMKDKGFELLNRQNLRPNDPSYVDSNYEFVFIKRRK